VTDKRLVDTPTLMGRAGSARALSVATITLNFGLVHAGGVRAVVTAVPNLRGPAVVEVYLAFVMMIALLG